MKILITGATGLVGQSLTDFCVLNKIVVNYLTTSKEKIVSEPYRQGYYWNISENYLDEEALDGVETIIHLAGSSVAERWTPENRNTIFESRISTARMLYSALSRKRKKEPITVKHFITASGVGGYPSAFDTLYDESYEKYAKGFLGGIVEEWEKAATEFKRLDILVACVRSGIVLDQEKGALQKMRKPIENGVGAVLGSGKQWQSWIHIEDIVGIYYHIFSNKLEGTYNGVAPNPVTNKELTGTIASVLNKKIILPNVPKFSLKLMLGDMATILLESQKASANKIQKEGYVFKYPVLDEALKSIFEVAVT